jgi:hypothetical protein
MYNIPILFLIFNRPDTTTQVFERIRAIKPAKLYVAADGARNGRPEETQRCAETRAIIDRIDWDCELKTLFRIENLGCKIAVSQAITWFFENEEYGVILEDDCLPDLSFFPFCEELLIRYKDDDRIGHIGGNCFLPGVIDGGLSYDFCSMTHIWGWATWRRAWVNVDISFRFWRNNRNNRFYLFCNKWEKFYFTSFISDALEVKNGLNPWAVFYLFALRLQNQLSIYPAVNLVTNIGLHSDLATHTTNNAGKYLIPLSSMNFPLKHPKYMLKNKNLDNKTVRKMFFSWKRLFRYWIFRKLLVVKMY